MTLLETRHRHDLDRQARPARKVLRALAGPRLRVVLLPREPRLFPRLGHRPDEVRAQIRVQLLRARLVRALGLRQLLESLSAGFIPLCH
jgi:hypothetical protein